MRLGQCYKTFAIFEEGEDIPDDDHQAEDWVGANTGLWTGAAIYWTWG